MRQLNTTTKGPLNYFTMMKMSDEVIEVLGPKGKNPIHAAKNATIEVEKGQADDTLQDAFPEMNKHDLMRISKSRKKKKKRNKKLALVCFARDQSTNSSNDTVEVTSTSTSEMKKYPWAVDSASHIAVGMKEGVSMYQDDTFQFFSETHEDQDVETIEVVNSKAKVWLENRLEKLTERYKEAKTKLSHQLKNQWENELEKFLAQVRAWKQSISQKQEKQRASLTAQYQCSVKTKENEARDAMKQYLVEKNTPQVNSINIKYQQQPWSQELEHMKDAEMKVVQNMFHEVQQNVQCKLQDYQKAKEIEYKNNCSKLEKHHQKRKMELSAAIHKIQTKFVEKHKQERTCYEKCQVEKYENLKREVLNNRNTLLHSGFEYKSTSELPAKGRQGIVVLCKEPTKQNCLSENQNGAAVLRYKRRKAVLSKKCIPAMLYIELQNEGLTVTLHSSKSVKDEKQFNCDFIPWGFKARQLLTDIICGELSTWESVNIECCSEDLQGSQMKCVISDMRKHGRKSTFEQVLEVKNASLKELENSFSFLKQNMEIKSRAQSRCEDLVAQSLHELQLVKQRVMTLQSQMKNVYNSDGTLHLSEEHHKKITLAIGKYESAQKRMKASQQQLATAQMKKKESVENLKNAFDEYQIALGLQGVNEILSIIEGTKTVMSKKRFQGCGDEKPSADHLLGLGYLEHKTVTTVMRPTKRKMLKDLMSFLKDTVGEKDQGIRGHERTDIDAEELFLLSTHPFCNDILSTTPSMGHVETKSWAEPGYQLYLAVPGAQNKEKGILPSRQNGDFFRHMHSEFSSTQGRQASSLLSRQHCRNIEDGYQSTIHSKVGMGDQDILKGYEFQLPRKRRTKCGTETKKLINGPLAIDDDNSANLAKKRKKDIAPPNLDSSSSRSASTFQEKHTQMSNPSFLSQPTIPLQSQLHSGYHSHNNSMKRISDRYNTLITFKPPESPQIPQPPSLQYQTQPSFQVQTQYPTQQRIPQLQYHQIQNVAQPYQRTPSHTSETHPFQRKG